MYLALQTNQITKGRWKILIYSAFALNERSKQKICHCPSAFSHLPSCKTGSVWKEKRDGGKRNRKQTLAGGGFVCPPVRLSVKYVQVNHSSVCVSISKPVYLPNSHLIFLYLYSDRKLICTLCTVCWIYPNRDFTPTVAITFIEREKYNRMKVFYCSQNIYQCGLMQLQNAGLPESLRMLVAHKYCLISRACFQLCITELPK